MLTWLLGVGEADGGGVGGGGEEGDGEHAQEGEEVGQPRHPTPPHPHTHAIPAPWDNLMTMRL